MTTRTNLFFSAIIIASIIAAVFLTGMGSEPTMVTIDAELYSQGSETLSVVVTANSAATATRAVERIGGQVSANLDAAGAVAATIPADQLDVLAMDPDVRAIASN